MWERNRLNHVFVPKMLLNWLFVHNLLFNLSFQSEGRADFSVEATLELAAFFPTDELLSHS